MATAPQSRRLNLTRDQLATFLTDQQQIRQFESLFAIVDQTQELIGIDFQYQADTAAARANNALAQISALSQETAVNDAVLNSKVQQALDAIPRLAQALELLSLAPVRNNVELEHDTNGVLPVKNGGTGQSTFTNGQLLIGNTTGNTLTKSTLTAGTNINISNGTGSITISVTGGISGIAALAKITSLGSDGSLTFANGIITAYIAPT